MKKRRTLFVLISLWHLVADAQTMVAVEPSAKQCGYATTGNPAIDQIHASIFKSRVTLTITAESVKTFVGEGGRLFSIRAMKVNLAGATSEHLALTKISLPPYAYLRIVINREGGGSREVRLPRQMPSIFLHDLRIGPISTVASGEFVHVMNGVKVDSGLFDGRQWAMKALINESDLVSGDTVVIERNSGEYVHSAIYLGEGLYLSKLAGAGELIVTDLASMLTGFDGRKALHATP